MKTNKPYVEQLKEHYNEFELKWKTKIRMKPTKWKRFWAWIWYWIAFPWVWLFYNIRDWRSAICVLLAFIIMSSSVWAFYLAALFCGWKNTAAGITLISIGSGVWAWWLSPLGSPFILYTTILAISIKAGFDKVQSKRHRCEKCGKLRHRCISVYDEEQDKMVYICRRCCK